MVAKAQNSIFKLEYIMVAKTILVYMISSIMSKSILRFLNHVFLSRNGFQTCTETNNVVFLLRHVKLFL